jgi:hypothetical protein
MGTAQAPDSEDHERHMEPELSPGYHRAGFPRRFPMTESTPPLGLDAWLERLSTLLPADIVEGAGPAERAVLLDLARIAAHRGERIAAPVTTYLAGVAFAGLPPAERLARLRTLLAALEA